MEASGISGSVSTASIMDGGAEDLFMYELLQNQALLPDVISELPAPDVPFPNAALPQAQQAPLPGMDYLYSMPPLSTQAPRLPATALKKENDQIAATFGTRGSQPQRSGSGVPPLPQLPPPEHFPPALQALAEQQRLFMERKYQEQQQRQQQQTEEREQQRLHMQVQQHQHQQSQHQHDQAEQLRTAHLHSLQQQVPGFLAVSASYQPQLAALAGHPNQQQHSQQPLFGTAGSAAAASDQSTAFGGFQQQLTTAAPAFPGFSSAMASSSRPMSAWPQDQKLAAAMSLDTDMAAVPAKMRTHSLGWMPDVAALTPSGVGSPNAALSSGFRSASDRTVRAAYDAASSAVGCAAARAPSMEDCSDDVFAPTGGMAGSSASPSCQPVRTLAAAAASAQTADCKDDTDMGLSKTREKNRVAQRRFRDRQREKDKEKERKLADMTRRLSELTHEKATLTAHNELLTKLLRQPPAPMPPAATRLRQPSSEGNSAHSPQSSGGAAVSGLNDRTNHVLMRLLEVMAHRMGDAHGGVTVTVQEGVPPMRLSRQQFADMSMRELVAIGRQYPQALSQALAEAGDDLTSPAGQRLAHLTWEAMSFKMYVGITHIVPAAMTDEEVLTAVGTAGEATPASVAVPKAIQVDRQLDMQALVASLRLAPHQQVTIAAMRRVMMHNLGLLLRRRQELVSSLTASVSISGADMQQDVTDVFRRTGAVMSGLRSSIWDEYYTLMQMRCFLFGSFTPPQVARAYLAAYPGSIDVVALVNCVAGQMGEPAAQELTRTAAASAHGDLLELYDVDDPEMKPLHQHNSVADFSGGPAAG